MVAAPMVKKEMFTVRKKNIPINDIETTITVHVYCLVLKYLLVGLLLDLLFHTFYKLSFTKDVAKVI